MINSNQRINNNIKDLLLITFNLLLLINLSIIFDWINFFINLKSPIFGLISSYFSIFSLTAIVSIFLGFIVKTQPYLFAILIRLIVIFYYHDFILQRIFGLSTISWIINLFPITIAIIGVKIGLYFSKQLSNKTIEKFQNIFFKIAIFMIIPLAITLIYIKPLIIQNKRNNLIKYIEKNYGKQSFSPGINRP